MSKGPGRIERAIRDLFDANPDLAFISQELAEHCFPDAAAVARKHLVSVLRAAHKIVAADPDWTAWRIEGQGRGWVFFNHANVQSYALAQLIAREYVYRSPRPGMFKDPVPDRAALLALLAPGGRCHQWLTNWAENVRAHILRRDGYTAAAAELEAELNAKAAARRAAWATSITEAFRFPTRGSESETLSLLSTILETFAQYVRDAAAINDPDTQRDELMLIAQNLDTLRGALGYADVPATLHHIVEQLSGATAEEHYNEITDAAAE